MSTYETLKGLKVKFLGADTSGDRLQEGELFYNSSDFNLKSHIALGAWSSGGNLVTATGGIAGCGTQTAALGFGGYVGPGTPNIVATTLEYNGNGWVGGGNQGSAKNYQGAAGAQTTALAFGGSKTIPTGPSGSTADTEEYNGSTWAEQNNLNEAKMGPGGLGTQTAAVSFGGGLQPGVSNTNTTEHYDGTNWTNVSGTLTSARRYLKGCGTQTAGLTAGGDGTSSNHYDGTNWTAGGNLTTSRPNVGALYGSQTHAIMGGGASGGTPVSGKSEEYDGTTWTEVADMAVGRYGQGSSNGSNANAGLGFGGYRAGSNGYTSSTEEWNISTSTVTGAAWASGGNLNAARGSTAGFGGKDDQVVAGGFIGTPAPADDDSKATVEEYNGSSWSEVTNMPSKRSSASGTGASQTSGMITGGIHTNQTTSVEYDGTNWTNGGDIPAVSRMSAQCGTVPASLRCGGAGNPGPAINQTIEYDGSSWTAGNNMPHAEYGHVLCGTQTASVFSGGHNNPSKDNLYEYDGTNWTTGTTLAVSIGNTAGSSGNGTQTAAMWMAGSSGNHTSNIYDGTTVITSAAIGTSRYSVANGGGGTSTAAIVSGGYTGTAQSAATEEFTGETTAVNAAKTIDFD